METCLCATSAACEPGRVKNLRHVLGEGQGQKTRGDGGGRLWCGECVVKMMRKVVSGWGRKRFSEQGKEEEGMFMGARWSRGACVLCETTIRLSPDATTKMSLR